MAVSLTMMMGRIGAVIGNLLFPVLFDLSCLGPFIMIGAACLGTDIKSMSTLNAYIRETLKN